MRGRRAGTRLQQFCDHFLVGDGCWEWIGVLSRGYGHFGVDRRTVRAHRFMWELLNGPIPDGLLVCHRCDNPKCVRPAHLFLGTKQENALDAVMKGRVAHAVFRPKAPSARMNRGGGKLTEADVLAIRALTTTPRAVIAARFGIFIGTVTKIRSGARWGHVSQTDFAGMKP